MFLGRNTEGILNDAKREFADLGEISVIARDNDALEAPSGMAKTTVGEFKPDTTKRYLVVANGGTSAQLLPIIKKMIEAGVSFEAVDLQRDGMTKAMENTGALFEQGAREKQEGLPKMLVLFLGNNTEGILRDARQSFGDEIPAIVVQRENDRLQAPAGVETTTAGAFKPSADRQYIIIANGGTSAQLLPTIEKMLKAGIVFEAHDLQRDGQVKVW